MTPVHNLDPCTAVCLDCGATNTEIDDNLVPICEKAEGPHRAGIIAVRRQLRLALHEAETAEVRLRHAEDLIVRLSREVRERKEVARELQATLDILTSPAPAAGFPTRYAHREGDAYGA